MSETIRTYVLTVQGGSFSAAARQLGVPPSTISRRVQRLEEDLGVRLLERTTRHLRPTEAGTIFYTRSLPILAALAEAEEHVRGLADRPAGELRVALPPSGGSSGLATLLNRFRTQHPAVTLSLHHDSRFVDLVAERFDVAIRGGERNDPGWACDLLWHDTWQVVASPGYLAEHGTPTAAADLAGHACLAQGNADSRPRWPLLAGGTVLITPVLRSNEMWMLAQAAAAGMGLAYLPTVAMNRVEERGLVPVLTDLIGENTSGYLVYPSDSLASAKVRAFVEFVRADVEAHGPPF